MVKVVPPTYPGLVPALAMKYRPPEAKVRFWHKVKAGLKESFESIARQYGVRADELIEFNFPGSVKGGRVNPDIVNWYLANHERTHCTHSIGYNYIFTGGEQIAIPNLDHVAARLSFGHNVPLIPQTTKMGCWAAGVAMILAWRDKLSIDPSTIAANPGGVPYLKQLQEGLNPNDATILRRWGLVVEAPQSYTVQGLADLLKRYGPLWVASAVPSAHIRVITGIEVDPDPDKAQVALNDPWEDGMAVFHWPNRGARYTRSYAQFAAEVANLGYREKKEPAPIYVAHLP